jgi:branched-chain amino acid transport system substrate-binding protein
MKIITDERLLAAALVQLFEQKTLAFEAGIRGRQRSIKVSCADHEGARTARIQQWNGKTWNVISDWYTADETITDPIVKEVSAKYATERKISPRDCSKEN